MAKLLDVDPSDLGIFDSIGRVLNIRSATQSSVINLELRVPRRRLIHPAVGVSRVSVERSGIRTTFVLQNRWKAVLTEESEILQIDDQSADAVLIVLEEKPA